MIRVGVLALQGAFAEHVLALRDLGVEATPVRRGSELEGLEGLVIPGGESTTISKLMVERELVGELRSRIEGGMPVLGTCAGMILLADRAEGFNGPSLKAMDIGVRRNAFGRQLDSFETDLDVRAIGPPPFHAVFIRAPLIERVGSGVEVLAALSDGTPVAARQGDRMALAFHPELTGDRRFHQLFLSLVANAASSSSQSVP